MVTQNDQFKFTVGDYYKMAEVGILKDTDKVKQIISEKGEFYCEAIGLTLDYAQFFPEL